MSGLRSRSVPAPGQAPLVAPNAAALLRRNAREFGDAVAIKFGDRAWTHREYFEESCHIAQLFDARLPREGPRHVAVLLDNTPDYLFVLGAAGLLGAAIVGLNHTRREEHLLRDIEHTHCSLVITEPRHEKLLAPIVGGGGGGKPDFAEAGGKDASRIDEMLAMAPRAVQSAVSGAQN